MVPIYLCSIIALFVFTQRFFLFWSIRNKHGSWFGSFLNNIEEQNFEAALNTCQDSTHPVAKVLTVATQTAMQRPDRVKAEAERVGMAELQKYERFLPLLSFIAQVAPLLGLLGTVLGMVKMFYGLQGDGLANVNASALSGGIWQALLTTAAGLIVAAPTLGAHLYLTSKVDILRSQLRDAVERLLTALPTELSTPLQQQYALSTPSLSPKEGKLLPGQALQSQERSIEVLTPSQEMLQAVQTGPKRPLPGEGV